MNGPKNMKHIFPTCLFICAILFSCTHEDEKQFSEPEIKLGTAKISGKLHNFDLVYYGDSIELTLNIAYPFTAETKEFSAYLNSDSSFYFEIPLQCNAIACLNSNLFNGTSLSVGLSPGEESKLEITSDQMEHITPKMENRIGFTSQDILNLQNFQVWDEFLQDKHFPPELFYNLNPSDFSQHALILMQERIDRSAVDSMFSPKGKTFLSNEFKLLYLNDRMMEYKRAIISNYRRFKTKEAADSLIVQDPGRTYYSFLKHFNLNNPQYLYNRFYSNVIQTILTNDTLQIPHIGDTPIEDWMKIVKTNLADLLGTDSGLFYDVLATNAYAIQFNNEQKPLSDKQKQNIKQYFKNKEITKILLAKNEEIIRLHEETQQHPVHTNETPQVALDKLMDSIISKYKGKVVVVDFWATWCGPCMDAMEKYREVKREFLDKNVVFIYITSSSSPEKLWETKIKTIGGEHYYLTPEEWEYLLDHLKFNGIPSYLFYDANGVLKNKITAYPGTEKMKKMIGKIL